MKMNYMWNNQISTQIEADYIHKTIKIINYTDDNMKRAFGINEHPTWKEYESFLEDRCMPRTRANIKEYLDEINVSNYDPILIIKKSQGKMAEDYNWIDIIDDNERVEPDDIEEERD